MMFVFHKSRTFFSSLDIPTYLFTFFNGKNKITILRKIFMVPLLFYHFNIIIVIFIHVLLVFFFFYPFSHVAFNFAHSNLILITSYSPLLNYNYTVYTVLYSLFSLMNTKDFSLFLPGLHNFNVRNREKGVFIQVLSFRCHVSHFGLLIFTVFWHKH